LANRIGKDAQSIQPVEAGNVNSSSEYLVEVSHDLEIKLKELFDYEVG